MKFISSFFIGAFLFSIVYFGSVLMLIDAPIPAEYWVAEMIAVKQEILRNQKGKQKIIIAGGSSTLFGVDAEYASRKLGISTINFGLHAGLKLEHILSLVSASAEHGDIVILQLEPPYYDCNFSFGPWQTRNIIGWGHDEWRAMNYWERSKLILTVPPTLLREMVIAKNTLLSNPSSISSRLDALNSNLALSRFHARAQPTSFNYSVTNLDDYGDILMADETRFKGDGYSYDKPDHVCADTANQLKDFVVNLEKLGIQVYFANTPYISTKDELGLLGKGEYKFLESFKKVGCFIDHRSDLIFERQYFFNSKLHLNSEGRQLRTNILIEAIRKNIFSKSCETNLSNKNPNTPAPD
jgi:hypothetical protein